MQTVAIVKKVTVTVEYQLVTGMTEDIYNPLSKAQNGFSYPFNKHSETRYIVEDSRNDVPSKMPYRQILDRFFSHLKESEHVVNDKFFTRL